MKTKSLHLFIQGKGGKDFWGTQKPQKTSVETFPCQMEKPLHYEAKTKARKTGKVKYSEALIKSPISMGLHAGGYQKRGVVEESRSTVSPRRSPEKQIKKRRPPERLAQKEPGKFIKRKSFEGKKPAFK